MKPLILDAGKIDWKSIADFRLTLASKVIRSGQANVLNELELRVFHVLQELEDEYHEQYPPVDGK